MVKLEQKQLYIVVLIVAVVIGVIGYYFYTTFQDSEEEIIPISEENEIQEEIINEEIEEQIIVHIAGEVKNPGIIKTKEGARIADVIEKAGGLNKEADITNINLAYAVEDGQKITIPKVGEQNQEYILEESQTVTTKEQGTSNQKVNLNKATIQELQTLQGIRRINSSKNYRLQKRKSEILNKSKT